jgi:tetratricopeptide (TPR) repeat protein
MVYAAHVLSAQLKSLDSRRFEELVAALVGEQDRDAVRVGADDGGVDIWVPSQGWGLQCKRFAGAIGWAKCEASLRNAHQRYLLKRYTFVFPADLSGSEQRTFDARLGASGVDHWGITQLRNLLELYPQWEVLLGGPSSVRVEADVRRPEPSAWFSGRDGELVAVEGRIESEGVAVIHGLGGVGKTELAAAWCERPSLRVEHRWWLIARDSEALLAGARRIGRDLGLAAAQVNDDDVVANVVEALRQLEAPWALVLDDAVQPADVAPFLRQTVNGRVLVTTLNPHWRFAGLDAIELRSLDDEAAGRLLANCSGRTLDNDLRALAVDDLGGLPLALVQVGAYLEQRPTFTTSAYREAFSRRAAELLARDEDHTQDHTVATVWSLSMEQAAEREPLARELLGLLAYLAPDRIPVSIFGAEEAGALSNQATLADAIAALRMFSLIGVDADLVTVHVHRLVQVVARAAISEDAASAVAVVAQLVFAALPPRMNEHEGVPAMRPLVDHALAVADHAADHEPTRLLAARLLSAAGNFARITGTFRLAKELFGRAVVVADASRKGVAHREEDRARFLDNYASICAETGDYDTAIATRLEALEIREAVLGPDHELTIKVVANLAGILNDVGRTPEALPLARRAWDHRCHGAPEVRAWGAHDVAEILLSAGEHEEALGFADEAVRIFAGPEGGSRGNLAWALELRTEILLAHDRAAEAHRDARQALRIRQAAGEGHVDVARAWLACAQVSQHEHHASRACAEARRVLDLTDGQLEDDHPDRIRAKRIIDRAV